MLTLLGRSHRNEDIILSALLLLFALSAAATPLQTPAAQPTSFGQLFSLEPENATFAPPCDDVQLRNVAQQVSQLKLSNENIFLLLDTYNLRLDYIKTLLAKRLPLDKESPQWIDVRVQSEVEATSTQASAHDVASQRSTGSAYLPTTPVQSTAGGGNNLPRIIESSLPGVTNQIQCTTVTPPAPPQVSYASVPYNAGCPAANAALPSTCGEALSQAGANAQSGIYQIYLPYAGRKRFYVYCLLDVNGGPAWTVVQRRQDGSIQFHREWREYQLGFGNLNGEFFIGLDHLHALTHVRLNELWIQMEDFENVSRYARYHNFAIGDVDEFYALNVLGKFEGNAGDSLRVCQGQKFSTKDADHDMWDRNCAVEYTGAWWYKACHDSNLNGQYLRGKYSKDKYGKGIDWAQWHGHEYSLKYVHMAIRPVQ